MKYTEIVSHCLTLDTDEIKILEKAESCAEEMLELVGMEENPLLRNEIDNLCDSFRSFWEAYENQ